MFLDVLTTCNTSTKICNNLSGQVLYRQFVFLFRFVVGHRNWDGIWSLIQQHWPNALDPLWKLSSIHTWIIDVVGLAACWFCYSTHPLLSHKINYFRWKQNETVNENIVVNRGWNFASDKTKIFYKLTSYQGDIWICDGIYIHMYIPISHKHCWMPIIPLQTESKHNSFPWTWILKLTRKY